MGNSREITIDSIPVLEDTTDTEVSTEVSLELLFPRPDLKRPNGINYCPVPRRLNNETVKITQIELDKFPFRKAAAEKTITRSITRSFDQPEKTKTLTRTSELRVSPPLPPDLIPPKIVRRNPWDYITLVSVVVLLSLCLAMGSKSFERFKNFGFQAKKSPPSRTVAKARSRAKR